MLIRHNLYHAITLQVAPCRPAIFHSVAKQARPSQTRTGKAEVTTIGQALRIARERAALTQTAVARAAGVDPSQINKLEADEYADPRFSTVARVCEVLGLSLDAVAINAGLRSGGRTAHFEASNIIHLIEGLQQVNRLNHKAVEHLQRLVDAFEVREKREARHSVQPRRRPKR